MNEVTFILAAISIALSLICLAATPSKESIFSRIRKLEGGQIQHKRAINQALHDLKLGTIKPGLVDGGDRYEVDFNGFQMRPIVKGERAYDKAQELDTKLNTLIKDLQLDYHGERQIKIPAYFKGTEGEEVAVYCKECNQEIDG